MPGFKYRLILANGEPADPPTFESSTPTWRPGDQIWVRPGYTLRVVGTVAGEDAGGHGEAHSRPVKAS
jgi:hypothetical protein